MKRRDSKSGWLLYLMVHFPFIWWWKIGITSAAIGADKRAKQVDRAVIGFPVPVMVLFVPGAYYIEQDLHRLFEPLKCRFYKGDGSTEFFWFFVAPPVFLFMVCVWLSYLYGIDLILGTNFFGAVVGFLLDAFHIIYIYLQQK